MSRFSFENTAIIVLLFNAAFLAVSFLIFRLVVHLLACFCRRDDSPIF